MNVEGAVQVFHRVEMVNPAGFEYLYGARWIFRLNEANLGCERLVRDNCDILPAFCFSKLNAECFVALIVHYPVIRGRSAEDMHHDGCCPECFGVLAYIKQGFAVSGPYCLAGGIEDVVREQFTAVQVLELQGILSAADVVSTVSKEVVVRRG